MENITKNEISITGALCLNTIEKFEISIRPNEHGKAKVNVLANKEIIKKVNRVNCNQVVKILNKDKVIFCGLIQNINYSYEGIIVYLDIDLTSMSKVLDSTYKKRSFQNKNRSIGEIMKIVNPSCQVNLYAKDRSLTKPIYQFQETDWQFMRRLASKLETCVYSDVRCEQATVNIGMKNDIEPLVLASESFGCGVSKNFFSEDTLYRMTDKSYFIFYEIESYIDYDIGKMVIFKNQIMNILEKKIFLRKSEVIYQYKIGNKKSVFLKKYSNLLFSGMTIEGKVLATNKQYIKIHLDIDSTQVEEEAYWYEWVPETGNIMYCMPQKGTRVQLYFKNEDEDSAIAVRCSRENGQTCKKMINPENKCFENESGKELYLKETEIGFANNNKENNFIVDDAVGIKLKSEKKINIVSNQNICIKASKIVLSTPAEIKIIQG